MLALTDIVSLLLNPRLNLQDSAIDNLSVIDASLVLTQLGLVAFLVLVSFWKMQQLWVQANKQVHAEREAEDLIEDHVKYFEQLRLRTYTSNPPLLVISRVCSDTLLVLTDFSDEVALSLTRMHHNGGFDALVADVTAKDATAHPERANKGAIEVYSNPLTRSSDDPLSNPED